MTYQRSRSIPTSNEGTTIASDPTGTVRGRSRHSRTSTSEGKSAERNSVRSRSVSRRLSTSLERPGSSHSRRSKSITERRRRRHTMRSSSPSRSGSRSCRQAKLSDFDPDDTITVQPELTVKAAMEMQLHAGTFSRRGSAASPLALSTQPSLSGSDNKSSSFPKPSIRRTKTDSFSAVKVSKSSGNLPSLASRRRSKASLGIFAIASNVTHDDTGSPQVVNRPVRKNDKSSSSFKRMPGRAVSFDSATLNPASSQHTSDTRSSTGSGSSSSSSKSSVDEAVRRMKGLQDKFRRSSQEGTSIKEDEHERLAKEVPLMNGITQTSSAVLNTSKRSSRKSGVKSAAAKSA